ncbi:MAG: alpha/beta hydrolase [Candidatus Rokubacteria bacterium]|nr:alpha/beta hydrolase [Candidatus Rokubacteria bacterium]
MPEVELRGGEVDGLNLHYVTAGGGPVVVLVHGLGGFAESWRHNLAALARVATVYAVDLPGFGRSSKPPTRYRLADAARALHGFVQAMGLGRVAIVGHSLGGAVGLTYALTHPARVERLALLGALVPGASYRLSWPYRLAATPMLGELLALCGCAPVYRAAIARCFHAPVADEVEYLVREAYEARTCPEAKAAYLATLRDIRRDIVDHAPDYRRALGALDAPILFIHGRQDRVVVPAHCGEAAEMLPGARVRWLDACGHFPQIEHADVVNGWLTEFLVARPAPR